MEWQAAGPENVAFHSGETGRGELSLATVRELASLPGRFAVCHVVKAGCVASRSQPPRPRHGRGHRPPSTRV